MTTETLCVPNFIQKMAIDWLGYLFRHGISRGRGILLKLVFSKGAFFDYNFNIISSGKPYAGNLKFGIDHQIFFFQVFEPHIIRILQSTASYLASQQMNVNFIDIGANVGLHSHFMLDLANSVHSFEPNPDIFNSLQAKWKEYQNTSFHIYQFGLGANNCQLEYYEPETHNTGTGSFVSGFPLNRTTSIVLPIRQGDEAIAEIGVNPVSLMKIDVEGFEPFVLQGLARTLKKDRPTIVMEMSAMTRQVMDKQNLSLGSLLYDDVALFEIQPLNQRGKFNLEKKSFQTLSDMHHDLLIVPQEYIDELLMQLLSF
jgi:FkbM family methyltransferase